MKKVLSVLLAASMVMGMSVTSMAADKVWGKGPAASEGTTDVTNLTFHDSMRVIFTDKTQDWVNLNDKMEDEFVFHPGDVAYFKIMENRFVDVPNYDAEPICGEVVGHEHVATCYKYELVCEKEVGHAHDENCDKELTCKLGVHTHTEMPKYWGYPGEKNGCYTWKPSQYYYGFWELTCGEEGHTHNDACYKVICTIEEGHEHVCGDAYDDTDCYDAVQVCDEVVGHEHEDFCYPTVKKQVSYTGPVDKDWAIYIKDKSSYIKSAEFSVSPEDAERKLTIADKNCDKYIKITFQDAYDELDIDEVDFYFYIADTSKNLHVKNDKSATAEVHYLFDNWMIEYVDFDFLNDVDTMTKWVTREGKAGKGTASFSFNKEAYYVVKMNPEEEVVFNFSTKYDKALDKAYNYDADIESYNFKGTKDNFNRVGDVIIPADDDTFVYEVVNGKAVEVEAEYVEDYEVIKGTKVDGWVIETNELGYYIVSDIELEIEAEEVEAEEPVEAEKANPETGAADFVGAAVAMAVVSVAAAGALALKK